MKRGPPLATAIHTASVLDDATTLAASENEMSKIIDDWFRPGKEKSTSIEG
jgi:hypothetical protein